MKKIALFVTFSLGLFSSGCSRLDLALRFADSYVVYKADDYFDLTSSQKDWLRREFEKDLAIIKNQLLPKIALDLDRLSKQIEIKKNFSEKEVEAELSSMLVTFQELIKTFSQSAVRFVSLLSIEQVDTFQKNYREKMEDFKDDSTPKKARERLLTSTKNWFGDLTNDQTKLIITFVDENPFPVESLVTNRLRLSDEFKKVFSKEESRNLFVEKIFSDYNSLLDENYKNQREKRNKNFSRLLATLLNSMTDDQRAELSSNLKDRSVMLSKIKN